MAQRKITNRWLFNSLGVIITILILVELAFAVSIRLFYYNSVRQALVAQANIVSSLLTKYSEQSSMDFDREVRSLIENFDQKDRMELMALDLGGNVLITSSGFEVNSRIDLPDFTNALSSSDGLGEYQGRLGDENVYAVTILSPHTEDIIAAVRLIVSLGKIDEIIYILIGMALLVGIAIVFFAVLSGSYFINSIVIPLGEIGTTARSIASGNFNIRLQKKNDDEVGELCDIINHMASELSATEKMKNDFISSVSHELRTPLTAIKGWGETILAETSSDHADPDTLNKGMGVIMKEADRLSLMVEELLDFSRMQSGRLRLSIARIDLLAELGEAVLMYTERAKREDISLIYDEPMFDAQVMADPNRLRQVFINVLDNAIKYSDPKDIVTVEATSTPDYLYISVADSGCGISREDLPKIKQKFYKANLTRRGSGIGLAVADDIMKMHHGSLDLESALGVGTTVTIKIPTLKKYEALTAPPQSTEG